MSHMYTQTRIIIGNRQGIPGSDTPRLPHDSGYSGNNRHCCAWEQIRPALYIIASILEGCCKADGSAIRELADESKMPYNRGE